MEGKTKTLEEMVPERHLKKYKKIFKEGTAQRFLRSRLYNHAINLEEGYKIPTPKGPNRLIEKEQSELEKWVQDQLKKGYIRESKSPFVAPFFYIEKKGGLELQPIQDYQNLNKIIAKKSYPLPWVDNLLETLKEAKIFTKMDLR